MLLGVEKLHALVKDVKLVENLCERELKNPEGAGFDLRIGEVFELKGDAFLGIEKRETPKIKTLASFDSKKEKSFVFLPGQYYLIKTIEKVNTPEGIEILFRPRTTMFRSGMMLITGAVPPGYCGELNFGIVNLGKSKVTIEMGARVVHAMFYQIDGATNLYRGQWQGGRTATKGVEKQI